jgi:hypothetical protein
VQFFSSSLVTAVAGLSWPSRAAANAAILAVGLVLQCALVLVVFRRGVARRSPAFTALLIFYPLRAGLLSALAGRADAEAYNAWFNAVTLAEVPLQAAVALEMLLRLIGELGGWTVRRASAVLACIVAASALTWFVHGQVSSPALVDRVQVFGWFVMLALFAVILASAQSPNLKYIAGGFGCFSLVQLAALEGRSYAMLRHDDSAYVGWSYVPACGYLAIAIWWMLALRGSVRASQRTSKLAS